MKVAGVALAVLAVSWQWTMPGMNVWGAFLVGMAGGALLAIRDV